MLLNSFVDYTFSIALSGLGSSGNLIEGGALRFAARLPLANFCRAFSGS
jgi:hypothetical protein